MSLYNTKIAEIRNKKVHDTDDILCTASAIRDLICMCDNFNDGSVIERDEANQWLVCLCKH
jgi:hypothetical protein